ncbi:hypothetical protein YC2023_094120 [Brassica napus]
MCSSRRDKAVATDHASIGAWTKSLGPPEVFPPPVREPHKLPDHHLATAGPPPCRCRTVVSRRSPPLCRHQTTASPPPVTRLVDRLGHSWRVDKSFTGGVRALSRMLFSFLFWPVSGQRVHTSLGSLLVAWSAMSGSMDLGISSHTMSDSPEVTGVTYLALNLSSLWYWTFKPVVGEIHPRQKSEFPEIQWH